MTLQDRLNTLLQQEVTAQERLAALLQKEAADARLEHGPGDEAYADLCEALAVLMTKPTHSTPIACAPTFGEVWVGEVRPDPEMLVRALRAEAEMQPIVRGPWGSSSGPL